MAIKMEWCVKLFQKEFQDNRKNLPSREIFLYYDVIVWLDMDNHIYHFRESRFDSICHFMSNKVSLSNGFFAIDEDTEFDDTIKPAFSHDTSVDIFYIFVGFENFTDTYLCLAIHGFIEELADCGIPDMKSVVEHKHACEESCPVSGRLKRCTSKKCKECPHKGYSSRHCIREMMKCISLYRSTFYRFPNQGCSEKEYSL